MPLDQMPKPHNFLWKLVEDYRKCQDSDMLNLLINDHTTWELLHIAQTEFVSLWNRPRWTWTWSTGLWLFQGTGSGSHVLQIKVISKLYPLLICQGSSTLSFSVIPCSPASLINLSLPTGCCTVSVWCQTQRTFHPKFSSWNCRSTAYFSNNTRVSTGLSFIFIISQLSLSCSCHRCLGLDVWGLFWQHPTILGMDVTSAAPVPVVVAHWPAAVSVVCWGGAR